jgi:hypothetical protein
MTGLLDTLTLDQCGNDFVSVLSTGSWADPNFTFTRNHKATSFWTIKKGNAIISHFVKYNNEVVNTLKGNVRIY